MVKKECKNRLDNMDRYFFSFSMKKNLAELIDRIMDSNIFESKSEFFRYCLLRYGQEVLELGKNFNLFKPEVLKVLL